MAYLMKCGHTADAIVKGGTLVCSKCLGNKPGADIVDRECHGTDGLKGRTAKCIYNCKSKVPSKWELPFFRYNPDKPYDYYYCGCEGWD